MRAEGAGHELAERLVRAGWLTNHDEARAAFNAGIVAVLRAEREAIAALLDDRAADLGSAPDANDSTAWAALELSTVAKTVRERAGV
jgi:hypothetical protein